MVAVPEVCTSAPAAMDGRAPLAHCHRVVAIVDTTVELLRPESDLLRVAAGIERVDVLVALDDAPVVALRSVGRLGHERPTGRPVESDVDNDEPDLDDVEPSAVDRPEIEDLGVPGLHVHHLRLRAPLGPPAEPDLVAALSELVGFDPEPGVYCLAPVASAGDLGRSVVGSAARRIAQVYGLPMLRYRCLELAVVPGQRPALDG